MAQISDQDPLVQIKVMEALKHGGSAALDAVTAVVPKPTVALVSTPIAKVKAFESDPSKLEDTHLTGEKRVVPDPKPLQDPVLYQTPNSSSSGSGGQDEVEHGGDFKLVSNKKKKKGRSNQKAPLHNKGQ